MRKSLLTFLLAAATLTVSAQLKVGQMQPRMNFAAAKGFSTKILKGENRPIEGSVKQWNIPNFNRERNTRADEDRQEKNYLYNYVITSQGTLANAFYADFTEPWQFSTYYSPELLKRFIGNTITEVATVISGQSTEVTFYIASGDGLADDEAEYYFTATGTYDELAQHGKPIDLQDDNGNSIATVGLSVGFNVEEPIVITKELAEKGLYVGYYTTLDQSKCTKLAEIIGADAPIMSVVHANGYLSGTGLIDGGSYSGIGWLTDVYTEGDAGLRDNDIELSYLSSARAETGDGVDLILMYTNYGLNPIQTMALTTSYNGQEYTMSGNGGNIPFAVYNVVRVSIEDLVNGRNPLKIAVQNVNGVEDTFTDDNEVESIVIATDNPAQPKAVMEEGTGTWCGWCPRGMIAMEQLQEEYGDDFIPIAVHSGDILQSDTYGIIGNVIYSYVGGYPAATLNRSIFGDPYYGDVTDENGNEVNYGISENVETILDTPVEAEVGVESTLSADKKTVDVTSHVRFNIPCNAGEYSIAYAITEDKVSDPNLTQTNYFAQYPAEDFGGDLNILKSYPYDWATEFNHVARGIWDAFGIAGSLEGQIANDQVTSHKMTLELPETILNTDNCHLIAMLIDNYDGMIVNACRVALGQSDATGISSTKNDVLNAKIGVANGNISINGNGMANVYTVDGKLVSKTAVNGQAEINVPAGSYVVRVTNGNNVVVKKVAL